MTNEFCHYDGCNHRNPDNCGACALTLLSQDAPNYAGWPLAYMENRRPIPEKWREAFNEELNSDNIPYRDNLYRHVAQYGVRFTA